MSSDKVLKDYSISEFSIKTYTPKKVQELGKQDNGFPTVNGIPMDLLGPSLYKLNDIYYRFDGNDWVEAIKYVDYFPSQPDGFAHEMIKECMEIAKRKKKYTVRITEYLQRDVEVYAESSAEACEVVDEKRSSEEIVLDYSDFNTHKVEVLYEQSY